MSRGQGSQHHYHMHNIYVRVCVIYIIYINFARIYQRILTIQLTKEAHDGTHAVPSFAFNIICAIFVDMYTFGEIASTCI